ncbi:hypothetical protein GCM10009836_68930 [Pseudonocardia ailaonensis]|uniref:Uncharacterized protein n=1 Tax=Pseudonocardia ailaonensis TaxID=367279 RepID=A0ABN2NNL4_9PSEU
MVRGKVPGVMAYLVDGHRRTECVELDPNPDDTPPTLIDMHNTSNG